MCRLRRT
ncbi:Putative calcium-dependent lipid-binding (CaLB domain) family protein [Zea mays]|nr:Putative calcium-dependent lipid-binding (CaLB domain) family protein [Zea mays]